MDDIQKSVSNLTDVSLLMAKHLISTKAKNANLVFSPVSVHVVLGLIAAGSKGPTLDQLLSFLKSKGTEELNSLSSQIVSQVLANGELLGGPRLSFTNGVWVDQSLRMKPTFKGTVENSYKAAASHVDFQTKAVDVNKDVNTWAERETSGLIKELLPYGSVDDSTRLIFANFVYFKGAWNRKLDGSNTQEDKFFLLNGSSVQVPYMTSKKKQYTRAFSGFSVLGLPYKQGDMYFFLPNAKDELPALAEKVGSEPGFLENHLPYQQVEVDDFCIPKFKLSFGFEASEVLKGLGFILGRFIIPCPLIRAPNKATEAIEVTKEVNLWVEKETSGLIKELLPSGSVDAWTRLIFANALYFKGAWNQKFDTSKTKEDKFFHLNGSSVQVPLMTSSKKQYIHAFSGFKVLGLPYEQGEDKRKFSMYILLQDAKDGLPALVEKVGSESGFLEGHLPYKRVKVGDFRVPKFKISFGFEASEILKALGLVLPFSGDGLTEMVESSIDQNLYVSRIFHKSFIKVNEEGTEAAAATASIMMPVSLVIENKEDFVADHPFLFVLRDDTTGVLLFTGQIHNPLVEQ